MNIDLSTMNIAGLVAFVVFCLAFVVAFTLLIRAKPKIKGSKGSIEIGEALQEKNTVKVEVTPSNNHHDGVTMRQLVMARNEIEGLENYLYDLLVNDGDYTEEQETMIRLRCELFGARLLYGISRCYAVNNIGKTLEDIEAYAGRTARELNYLFEVFPEEYGMKEKLEGNWFRKALFTIIRDGKGL